MSDIWLLITRNTDFAFGVWERDTEKNKGRYAATENKNAYLLGYLLQRDMNYVLFSSITMTTFEIHLHCLY